MRVIVSDTSALIDLRKGSLVEALLRLPYQVLVPDLLFEDELLGLPPAEKRAMRRQGLQVVPVPGDLIDQAVQLAYRHPVLRLNDCITFVLAARTADNILLTGDRRLRALAGMHGIEAHGALWAADQMCAQRAATPAALRAALTIWLQDRAVWLPEREIRARLRRLRGR
jgi:hypothetical protein